MATRAKIVKFAAFKKWDTFLKDSIEIQGVIQSFKQSDESNFDNKFSIVWIDDLGQLVFGKRQKETKILNIDGLTLDVNFYEYFPTISNIYSRSHINLTQSIERLLFIRLPISILKEIDKEKAESLSQNSTLSVGMIFRKCFRGEYYDIELAQCLPCKPTFFSSKNNFLEPSSCASCIDQPFYCYGGDKLSPKPGFWRRDEKSFKFIACPNTKGSNCYFRKYFYIRIYA